MNPSPSHPTIKALLQVVSTYSITAGNHPNAVFLEDDTYAKVARGKYTGFMVFCNEQDHPSKLSERQKQPQVIPGKEIPTGFFYVGRCRWLWSTENLIGVILHTDVEIGREKSRYGTQAENTLWLEQQNRSEDIAWATKKINWLWEQTFPEKVKPVITLDEKTRVMNWDDYIDIGDYMNRD